MLCMKKICKNRRTNRNSTNRSCGYGDMIGACSEKWLLTFHEDKYRTMNIGHHNQQAVYHLNQRQLEKTTQERALGIIVSANLKSPVHVSKVAAKVNSRLGTIKSNFSVLTRDIPLPLYLSPVHSVLDCGVQVGLQGIRTSD